MMADPKEKVKRGRRSVKLDFEELFEKFHIELKIEYDNELASYF